MNNARQIRYERTQCSRCDGTGHYSYNPINGTTCFKCGGAKEVLTKKGAEAKKAVDDLKALLCTVAAAEVEAGDVVQLAHSRRWLKVVEITGGYSRAKIDGEWVDLTTIVAGGVHHSLTQDAPVTRFPRPEQWDQIFALAKTLPGAEVIEKGESL